MTGLGSEPRSVGLCSPHPNYRDWEDRDTHAHSTRPVSAHAASARALCTHPHSAARPDRVWVGFESSAKPRQVLNLELPGPSPSSFLPVSLLPSSSMCLAHTGACLFVKEQIEERFSSAQRVVMISQHRFGKHSHGPQPQREPRNGLPGREARRPRLRRQLAVSPRLSCGGSIVKVGRA